MLKRRDFVYIEQAITRGIIEDNQIKSNKINLPSRNSCVITEDGWYGKAAKVTVTSVTKRYTKIHTKDAQKRRVNKAV